MNVECNENTTAALEESLAYLRTLANFGGTMVQSEHAKKLSSAVLQKMAELLALSLLAFYGLWLVTYTMG